MTGDREPEIDHIVYGVGDLAAGIAHLERLLGVRAAFGGKHRGGTHNALLGLGGSSYLEIIAPDPDQAVAGPLAFGVQQGMRPRIASWALRTAEIDEQAERSRRAGYDPGQVTTMSRVREDGATVQWRMTLGRPAGASRVMPFLIDWGDAPHPCLSAPAGVRLVALRGEDPHPEQVTPLLRGIGAELAVAPGPDSCLICTLQSANGTVELR